MQLVQITVPGSYATVQQEIVAQIGSYCYSDGSETYYLQAPCPIQLVDDLIDPCNAYLYRYSKKEDFKLYSQATDMIDNHTTNVEVCVTKVKAVKFFPRF